MMAKRIRKPQIEDHEEPEARYMKIVPVHTKWFSFRFWMDNAKRAETART